MNNHWKNFTEEQTHCCYEEGDDHFLWFQRRQEIVFLTVNQGNY